MKKIKIVLVIVVVAFIVFIVYRNINKKEITFRDSEDNLLMSDDVLENKNPARAATDIDGYPALYLKIKDKKTLYKITNEVSKRDNNVIVIWYGFEKGKDSYKKEKETCGDLEKSNCISLATVTTGLNDDEILVTRFYEWDKVEEIVKRINKSKSIF